MKYSKLHLMVIFILLHAGCKKGNDSDQMALEPKLTENDYAANIMKNPEVKLLVYVNFSGGLLDNFRIVRSDPSVAPPKVAMLVEKLESNMPGDGGWYISYGEWITQSTGEKVPAILQIETSKIIEKTGSSSK